MKFQPEGKSVRELRDFAKKEQINLPVRHLKWEDLVERIEKGLAINEVKKEEKAKEAVKRQLKLEEDVVKAKEELMYEDDLDVSLEELITKQRVRIKKLLKRKVEEAGNHKIPTLQDAIKVSRKEGIEQPITLQSLLRQKQAEQARRANNAQAIHNVN
jgi:hypothetical protein